MRRHTHGEDDVQSRRLNRRFKCSRPGCFEPSRPPELLFSAGVMQFHEDDKQEGKKTNKNKKLVRGGRYNPRPSRFNVMQSSLNTHMNNEYYV